MIKQLNHPFNHFLFPFHLKYINSIKFSQSLTNLHQKPLRFYATTNNLHHTNHTSPSPLYYDNINRNKGIMDLSSESIEAIRYRLKTSGKLTYKFNYDTTKKLREAAVLMPLCIVNHEPSVLFTIRSMTLKTHTGEVSFPGGKRDLTDPTLESTALRETYEEIGVPSSKIDVLGEVSPLPNKDRTMKVHPFIGFIKYPIDINKINFNEDEVYDVFSVALKDLLNHDNKKWRRFSDSKIKYPVFDAPKEVGLEIWGLTAFILENVLRTINRKT